MKRTAALFFVLLFSLIATAQSTGPTFLQGFQSKGAASFGTTASPASGALIDMVSLTKGLLIPRMNTTQRNAIASPPIGLRVFDTTLGTDIVWTGSVWKAILLSGNIVDSDIASGAAINFQKLKPSLSNIVMGTDANGYLFPSATSLSDLSAVQGAQGNFQTQIQGNADAITAHIYGTGNAHAALKITNSASGNIVSTNVQAALNEVQTHIDSANAAITSNNAPVAAATSSNTPSTIVKRDASGNFAAGTITGNLTGNASGSASSITGINPIANGGTGQTTQQSALNSLTGTQSSGKYVRSDGTNSSLSSIVAADVPTLNQNTTGTAANVTGIVAKANGGSGQDNTNITFPSTGVLDTAAGTFTLTNKTLTDPIISDAVRLTEQSATPSTPASGTKRLYAKSDGNVYTLDSTGLEKAVGAGAGGAGGINFIPNSDASSLVGWSAFNNSFSQNQATLGNSTVDTVGDGINVSFPVQSQQFDAFIYTTTGTAIGGLTNGGMYYYGQITNSATTGYFQVTATSGGTAIDLTAQGSGIHTFTPYQAQFVNGIQNTGYNAPTATLALTSSSPLRGSSSFLYTPASTYTQGFSVPFTIDAIDATRGMEVSFDYQFATPANYVTGPLAGLVVTVWDATAKVALPLDTSAVLNYPVNQVSNTFKAHFTAGSGLNYVLAVSQIDQTTNWGSIKTDNFKATPYIPSTPISNGVKNSDFEYGLTNWVQSTGNLGRTRTSVGSGMYSAAYTPGNVSGAFVGTDYIKIPTYWYGQPGVAYCSAAWSNGGVPTFNLQLFDGSTAFVSRPLNYSANVANQKVTAVYFTWPAQGTIANAVQLRLISTAATGNGSLYFDDCYFGLQSLAVLPPNSSTNYMSNGNFASGPQGFSLFTTTLTGTSPTGAITTGASSIQTLTTNNTNPLDITSPVNLYMASTGAISAGQGIISDPFTIDRKAIATQLSSTFAYEVQSGLANLNMTGTTANTFSVWLYNVTAGTWLQPNQNSYSMTTGTLPAVTPPITWQSAGVSTNTQYRLAVLATNASAGAVGINFNSFNTSVLTKSYGASITDLQSVGTNIWATTSGAATKGGVVTDVVRLAKVGDHARIKGEYLQNSAGSNSGDILITLPNNLKFDSAKVGFNTGALNAGNAYAWGTAVSLGSAAVSNGGGNAVGTGVIVPYDATRFRIFVMFTGNGTSGASSYTGVFGTNFGLASNTLYLTYDFEAPILGWGSSQLISADVDSRPITARASITNAVSTTALSPFNYNNIEYDSHNGITVSATAWRYTFPRSGYFRTCVSYYFGGTASTGLLYKNGVVHSALSTALANSLVGTGCTTVQANTGDYIYFATNNTATPTQGNPPSLQASNWITIDQISSSTQLAAGDSVNVQYALAGSQAVAAGSYLKFDTKIIDSCNCYNSTTGVFTAPSPGVYDLNAVNTHNSGGGSTRWIINANPRGYIGTASGAGYVYAGGMQFRLNQGDTVGIFGPNTSITFQASDATGLYTNQISIKKVGN